MECWTIEVLDPENAPVFDGYFRAGGFTAGTWRASYGHSLTEAAITHGAKEWSWASLDAGRVFEVAFADEADWLRFRATPAVRAALDAVPDPVHGLHIYSGRGGTSSSSLPRRPQPAPLVGAAALPRPEPSLHASDRTELRPEPGLAAG